jgi:hypothetical protein
MFSCWNKATKVMPITTSLKRQRVSLNQFSNISHMCHVISPVIVLEESNPVEHEILETHKMGLLDVKKLLTIGHLAVKASTHQHHYNDTKFQLSALKESYDVMMNTLKLQSNNDLEAQRQVYQELLNEIKTRHTEQLELVKNEFLQAKRQLEIVSASTEEAIEEKVRSRVNHETTIMQERIRHQKAREEDLLCQLANAKVEREQMQRDFIKTIKDEDVAALQAQIAMLKGQNHTKGILGENAITELLAGQFLEYEILDKSGTAAESDIHVVRNNDNCFIAIESKNKKCITNQDVEKSIRDIGFLKSKYGNRFVGYLFTSLRTPNIPRKGLRFEFTDGVPTIWFGMDNSDDSVLSQQLQTSLPIMVRLLFTLADTKLHNSADTTNTFIELQSLLSSLIQRLEHSQKTIASMSHSLKSIQDDNNNMYAMVLEFISANGLNNTATPTKTQPVKRKALSIDSEGDGGLNCVKCGREFSRKCDLQRHQNKCIV